MITLCAIALTAVMIGLQLKTMKNDLSQYVSLAGLVLIFIAALPGIRTVFQQFEEIGQKLSLDNQYMVILMKILGITYMAELTSGICKDAGFHTLGNQMEILGKILICAVSMPVMIAVLELLSKMMGG
ncbi:MAG: stage III sporulation AC/AD family protein [Clostridiales bacterium]|nr:stage III sporulation AC/AD family protein [Clostridiales bacterium]